MSAAFVALLLPAAWVGWLVAQGSAGDLGDPTDGDMWQFVVLVWMSGVGAGVLLMAAR